jgi:hypothetical protein
MDTCWRAAYTNTHEGRATTRASCVFVYAARQNDLSGQLKYELMKDMHMMINIILCMLH